MNSVLQSPSPPLTPLAVSIPDAAAMLGLSPHTIRWYIRHGKIRPVRFGRRVSIPMAECERLAREGVSARPETPPLTEASK